MRELLSSTSNQPFIGHGRNVSPGSLLALIFAVALGSALFSVNYRATLERQRPSCHGCIEV